jgi:predicted DNA-binding protein
MKSKNNSKNKRITVRLHTSEMDLLENHSLLHQKPKAYLVRYMINYYLKGKQ